MSEMMIFKSIQQKIKTDTGNDVKVVHVGYQPMLYEGYTECRAYTADGQCYSRLYKGSAKVTAFTLIPNKENK